MKRYLFLLLVLCCPLLSYAQESEFPTMKHYEYEPWQIKNEDGSQEDNFWDNGNVKVEYIDLGDGREMRKEYFANGFKKMTLEVRRVESTDSIEIFDLDLDDYVAKVVIGYKDIPDGNYMEFDIAETRQGPKEKPITIGQYKNGKMVGNWKTEKEHGEMAVANYNEEGLLEGEYIVYYPSAEKPMALIKTKGQFGIIEKQIDSVDADGKNISKTIKESKRIGEWTTMDKAGKVLETKNYDDK